MNLFVKSKTFQYPLYNLLHSDLWTDLRIFLVSEYFVPLPYSSFLNSHVYVFGGWQDQSLHGTFVHARTGTHRHARTGTHCTRMLEPFFLPLLLVLYAFMTFLFEKILSSESNFVSELIFAASFVDCYYLFFLICFSWSL